MSEAQRLRRRAALLIGAAIILTALCPYVGAKELAGAPFDAEIDAKIFWRLRLPRVCLAFLAGAALGTGGLVFQAIFRNPLATPYTLGVASGASFGASLALRLGVSGTAFGFSAVNIGGLLGALLTTAIVFCLSSGRRYLATSTMLLAGVAISFFFSSLILVLQYLSDFTQSFRVVRWLMGGLEVIGFQPVFALLFFVLFGAGAAAWFIRELDLLSTGDEFAAGRGLDAFRVKSRLFVIVSLMIGGVVSFTGPIGFVGMIVPHTCRLLVGCRHGLLMPVTLVVAGAFLAVCDAFARTIIAPAEIPVGVITALLGGPFFLWLLVRRDWALGEF